MTDDPYVRHIPANPTFNFVLTAGSFVTYTDSSQIPSLIIPDDRRPLPLRSSSPIHSQRPPGELHRLAPGCEGPGLARDGYCLGGGGC